MINNKLCGITTDPYDAITLATKSGTLEAVPTLLNASSFSVTWKSSGATSGSVKPYEHVHVR